MDTRMDARSLARTHTHTSTHARTHARARTHTHTNAPRDRSDHSTSRQRRRRNPELEFATRRRRRRERGIIPGRERPRRCRFCGGGGGGRSCEADCLAGGDSGGDVEQEGAAPGHLRVWGSNLRVRASDRNSSVWSETTQVQGGEKNSKLQPERQNSPFYSPIKSARRERLQDRESFKCMHGA